MAAEADEQGASSEDLLPGQADPDTDAKVLARKMYCQDNMWWIGPEVGDDLVWARAPVAQPARGPGLRLCFGFAAAQVHLREVPPRRGWIWQSINCSLTFREENLCLLR